MRLPFSRLAIPALLAGLLPTTLTSSLTDDTICTSLTSLSLTNLDTNLTGHTTLAEQLPSNSTFTGNTSETSYNTPLTSLPSLCRIALYLPTSAHTSISAEIWLPLPSQWTSRFLAVGNGGFAGGINYPDIAWGVQKGFATVSMNAGHNGSQLDGSFFLNARAGDETRMDWGWRGLHVATVAAKEVVQAYYGVAASWNYYAGCSTGGRQGLSAAQRFPSDYDGILAGSAIAWQTHTSAWQTWVALRQFPNTSASYIPESMWPVIHAAVLEQCDGMDGLLDGILMDPTRCAFRPQELLCGQEGMEASACLNGEQVKNLERMYTPWLDTDGTLVNPGLSPGGELSFSSLMNGETPLFGPTFYQDAVYNDTNWDWATTDVETVKFGDSVDPGGCNAYDPDMREFEQRGGKVVQYHGYADPLIPAMNAPAWYDEVNYFYEGLGRAREVENWYRLFMVPGMGHCSGGVGAWVLDGASQSGYVPEVNGSEYSMLYSLIEWTEARASHSSFTPETVMGTKFVDDMPSLGVKLTRPICRWPDTAVYLGSGNISDGSSWACTGKGVY